MEILDRLPAEFPAPILLAQHLSAGHRSELPQPLALRTKLRVKFADDQEYLQPGTVYVVPPDQHLLVSERGRIKLSNSSKVCFTRPAADVLFLSVALPYKQRAIAVVLSGCGQDGAMGVRALAGVGGITIAQLPESCYYPGMPKAALGTGCLSYSLPLDGIAKALFSLVMVRGAPLGSTRRCPCPEFTPEEKHSGLCQEGLNTTVAEALLSSFEITLSP